MSWGWGGLRKGVAKWSSQGGRGPGEFEPRISTTPYPTPKLGISARHAVSKISGCGVGAPNPIGNPALSTPTQVICGVGAPPKMSFNIPHLVSGLSDLSRFGTLCFPGLRKIRGEAPFFHQFGEFGEQSR